MTDGDGPSGRSTRRRIVAIVAALAVAILAAPGLVAADASVDLGCAAGDGGGPVYATDTGLAVEDNDTAAVAPFGEFPTNRTVRFADAEYANVSFSAAGPASVRLEERRDGRTCLAAVNASAHDLSIEADGDGYLTVEGSLDALAFATFDFEASDASLAYDATGPLNVTIHRTGLDEGESVSVESLDSDAIDDEATVTGDGELVLALPTGERTIGLFVADGGGGGSIPLPPPPPSTDPAAFVVDALTLDADRMAVGETVTVTATVTNVGDEAGTTALDLVVDGDAVATEAVSLDGGETTDVEFRQSFDSAGDFDVSLDDEFVGTVTVVDAESDDRAGDEPDDRTADDGSADDPSGDGVPGFGVVAALLALAAVTRLIRR